MHSRISIIFLVFLCGAIAFAGCTSNPSPVSPTPGPGTGTGTPTGSASAGMTFTTAPTDAIPAYNQVTIDVGEKDYLGIIPVIFQGGLGQIHVKKIDVKLTRIDGTVQTASLGIKKGDELDLQGTRGSGSLRGQIDRVEVWVTMDNGLTYKTNDELSEYRTR
jgi:hypothetical protein